MTVADLINRMKRYEKNAEMIFDAEEPIGTPTDLVMPRRRWFKRNKPVAVAGGAEPGDAGTHQKAGVAAPGDK
jgi:hypothetical protein